MPDSVLAIPENQREHRVGAGHPSFLQLDLQRYYVRALLPVRLSDGHEFRFGVWLEVREFDDDDAEKRWFSRLFEFRQGHVLTFALRGSRVPPITIGCNGGTGEISLADGSAIWSYQFVMSDFLTDVQNTLRSLLEGCRNGVRERAEHVLGAMHQMHRDCCACSREGDSR